jgi:hypothetical protein
MSYIFRTLVLSLLFVRFFFAQPLTPGQAIDRYLAGPGEQQTKCSDWVYAVQIDATMPQLKKQGTMSGLKVVSRLGRTAYHDLRFTGDNLVKTAVIARFLANDVKPHEPGAAVTRENYSFVYDRTSDYNGLTAYVFQLKPARKSIGLLKGELWLEAATAQPLRLWGDFVKSPSFFVRNIRVVQDFQRIGDSSHPLRLLLIVDTRIAGHVEMAVWLHPLDGESAEAVAGGGSAGLASPELGRCNDSSAKMGPK